MTTTRLRSIVGLGAIALLAGCTAGTKASNAGAAGNGGTAGSSGGGTTGSGGTSTGTGGSNDGGGHDIAVSDTASDGVCASNTVSAEPVPLDLYMVLDTSKSMKDPTSSAIPKWDAVRTALNAFFTNANSAGLGIGLKYFPQETSAPETCAADGDCGTFGPCDFRLACVGNNVNSVVDTSTQLCPMATTTCSMAGQTCQRVYDCSAAGGYPCVRQGTGQCTGCTQYTGYCRGRDVCTATSYATPDVAIAALPGAAGALSNSLMAHMPGGYTPTGPALQGAIDFAHQRLSTVTDHRIAIVLVTDGLPGGFIPGFPPPGCTPADISPGITTLLSGASRPAAGTPPVLTFVIGVFAPGDTNAQSNLDMLAAAGQPTANNGKAVIIDTSQNVSQALQDALKQVQSKAIACDFQIPTSGVSFDKVNVSFTTGGSDMPIGHAAAADGKMGTGCDSRGGWYYDKDYKNDAGTPSKISVCPSTCQMFQGDLNGKVNVVLGCPTIDVG